MMLRSIYRQSLAVLLLSVISAILVWQTLFTVVVIAPGASRVAESTATQLRAIELSLNALDRHGKRPYLDQLATEAAANIHFAEAAPEDGRQPTSIFARQLIRQFAANGMSDTRSLMVDGSGLLWVRLGDPDGDVWMTLQRERDRGSGRGFPVIAGLAIAIALVGGAIMQTRVARPLHHLAHQVALMEPGHATAIDVSGPSEVAAVAGQFNALVDRIRDAEAERALMLAGVSHDLRTPLTKLRLSLEMLNNSDDELVEGAKRQIVQIDSMMTQFLEYARGFDDEPTQEISIQNLLKQVEGTIPQGVTFTVARHTTGHICAKPNAVSRALANLIINADRYGKPPISLNIDQHSKSGCVFEVCDSGDGFADSDALSLIKPFIRGTTARSGEGTGLGLAIVDQVARAHRGHLSFLHTDTGFCVRLCIGHDEECAF